MRTLILVLLCLLLIPVTVFAVDSNSEVTNFPAKANVPPNKTWIIKFTQELDTQSALSSFINVVDSENNLITVSTAFGSDGKSIEIYPPEGGYLPDRKYFITISKNIKCKTGNTIKKPVRMEFNIASSSSIVTIQNVSAYNNTIAVSLSGYIVGWLEISDFLVTQSINNAAAKTITPTYIKTNGKTLYLEIFPVIPATYDTQNVVYTVSYKGGTPVSAPVFQVLGDVTADGNFNTPCRIAVDSYGNLYVADHFNGVIKKKVNGSSTWTEIAGNGSSRGYGTPNSVAVDNSGNLYMTAFSEMHNRPGIYVFTNGSNNWTDITGNYYEDINYVENLEDIFGVAVDSLGNIYTISNGMREGNKIKMLSSGSSTWTDITGKDDFSSPSGIAVDSSSNIYVVDGGNNKIKELVKGSNTWTDITGNEKFNNPSDVAVDYSSNVYVTDLGNKKIKKLVKGNWTDITGNTKDIDTPVGIAVDSIGNVYITNTVTNRIKKISQ